MPAEGKFESYISVDKLRNKFLICKLGDKEYCIKLYHVKEILPVTAYTPVPHLPDYIVGLINVRGKVIPVIDVRLRLGMERAEYNDRTCNVIVEHEKGDVGLIFDLVTEVLNVDEKEIMSTKSAHKSDNDFIKGLLKVDGKVRYVIAFNNLLGVS